MRLHRMVARLYLLAFCSLVAGSGCTTPAVGAPCLPEQVPDQGFDDSEAYIESSSVQCETRVCLVYKLAGDPRVETCKPASSVPECSEADKKANKCAPSGATCAVEEEINRHVYCSCRCDAGDTGFAECECPEGFSCETILERGGPGVRGKYCVRNGTVTN